MSEQQTLLLVLALIYGGECAFWLGRNDVLFSAWVGKAWRFGVGGPLLPNDRGGFRLAPILPPLGTSLVARVMPLSLSPDGALAWTGVSLHPDGRPPQPGGFARFEDMTLIEREGRKVFLNGALFLKAPTSHHATHIARELAAQSKQNREQRAEAQREWLRRHFDADLVKRRLEEARIWQRRLRCAGLVLFASLFVALPVAMAVVGLAHCWPIVLAALLVQTGTQAFLFARAHQSLFGERRDADTFTHLLTMLVAPPAAVRAHDCLTMNLGGTAHPLAVARAVCGPGEFRALAGLVLRDLVYPRLPQFSSSDEAAVATETRWRAALLAGVENLLRNAELEPAALLAAPAPSEPCNRSHCPRCLAQFITDSGRCADCGGRELVAFRVEGGVAADARRS